MRSGIFPVDKILLDKALARYEYYEYVLLLHMNTNTNITYEYI